MQSYFEYRHFVTFADTNMVGNVYFASYLLWQGACRERFLAEHAPGVIDRLAADFVLATVSCSCDYFSELFATDEVAVRMSLADVTDHRISMNFDYFRANRGPAQLVARGAQTVACMVRTGDQLSPAGLPADLAAALNRYAGGTILAAPSLLSS
jgi:enediyne biosynthesis thioesterase